MPGTLTSAFLALRLFLGRDFEHEVIPFDQILDAVVSLRKAGVTILLVEQNVTAALAIADRAYVIETGRIVLAGASGDLADDPRLNHTVEVVRGVRGEEAGALLREFFRERR